MANLTAAKRRKMSRKEFAMSGDRFPINDDEHARLAIGGATRAERAGNISEAEAAKIKEMARTKLGDGRGGGIAVHPNLSHSGIHDANHKRKY